MQHREQPPLPSRRLDTSVRVGDVTEPSTNARAVLGLASPSYPPGGAEASGRPCAAGPGWTGRAPNAKRAPPSKMWHQSRPSAGGLLTAQLAIQRAIGLWESGKGGRAKRRTPRSVARLRLVLPFVGRPRALVLFGWRLELDVGVVDGGRFRMMPHLRRCGIIRHRAPQGLWAHSWSSGQRSGSGTAGRADGRREEAQDAGPGSGNGAAYPRAAAIH